MILSLMKDFEEQLKTMLLRLESAVGDIEQTGRYVKRPVFLASLKESLVAGYQVSIKPYLTPQEASVECGDSVAFVAERAADGIIGRYGGDGNPLYSRAELYSAIRECRWHKDGKSMLEAKAA